MADFSGKTILVTGASSGIGRAVAESLISEGVRVVAVSRDVSRLSGLDASGDRLLPVSLNLLDVPSFPAAVERLPSLDGVVHGAGIVLVRPLALFSLEQYRQVLDTNLTAPLALTGEMLRQRKLVRGGSLVFVSSINGNPIGVKGSTAYAASKAGLVGAAKVLALELAPQGIRVNCVLPGAVDTPMQASLPHVSPESRRAEQEAYPLGKRFAQPSEIASAILFLLSGQSGFITGQTLTVDGGCSVQ